ncbi:uncharacterized protein LOC122508317 [Leptopilina heterotoma]|uniref:uncharacterized protein LOC122508317 n=1 Tax=Leptopilina heterotoma TaxID=63436 RepID=UPI001CA7FE59|nr:uncharacterized protein LOC122508317 [Leptopilina heterotoma]XP_043477536.1 uncharacterized protein LOC122508317 [Leptopilina heterotoma]XP_043477542.1 uncharacterized protein LOC122508317 [Leptopilina heterotoma]XP_043477548.1 uncharacterized protein LOC122508317 [Leptopilina heterotoma]XP_043477553.1 uncharacterized protein LOC122508317 [Leptopilina heterotoma]
MKFNMEVLYFLLLLVNINNIYITESTNYDDNYEDPEEIQDGLLHLPYCAFLNIYNYSKLIEKFLTMRTVTNLLIVIADDMEDGIVLANFLSNGNRVKFAVEELSENEVMLQNEILRNFYFFYSSLKKTHIFVYPSNAPNQVLAQYLTNQTVESANRLKVALTCKSDNIRETLNSTLLFTLNVLELDMRQRRCELEYNIIFIPLNIHDSGKCKFEVEKLKHYFFISFVRFGTTAYINFDLFEDRSIFKTLTREEQLHFLVLKPLIDDEEHVNTMCSKPQSFLENDYLLRTEELINLRPPPVPETNIINNECFRDIQTTETSFITDLSILPDWLILSIKNITNIDLKGKESVYVLLDKLCINTEKLKIFQLLCSTKNIINNESILLNYFKQIVNYYSEQQKRWFSISNDCFENDMNTEESQTSTEVHQTDYNRQPKLKKNFFGFQGFIDETKKNMLPISNQLKNYTCKYFELPALIELKKILITKLESVNLLLVIAVDMKDGIKLAEFVSSKNRVDYLDEISIKYPMTAENIMQNYYLYYSRLTNTYILVYPSNAPNKLLATYLSKIIINSVSNIKIALTYNGGINKDSLNSLFLFTSKVLELNIEDYFKIPDSVITILPANIEENSDLAHELKREILKNFIAKFKRLEEQRELTSWFNKKSNIMNLHYKDLLEYIIIQHSATNFYKYQNEKNVPLKIASAFYDTNYMSSKDIINIRYLLNNFSANEECIRSMFPLMDEKHVNKLSAVDISSLKGLLSFPTWIIKSKQEMSINKFQNDKLVKKFITDICNGSNEIEIVQMICLLRYMDDINNNQESKWLSLLQDYIINYYYHEEKPWFYQLELIYEDMHASKAMMQTKLQNLYEEIFQIDKKKQGLMMEAFHMVNNSLNSKIDYSCSALNNKNYKLQLRGTIFNFSQILYTQYCPGKVIVLEMFALDKIIIDEDLISNELQQVIINAPIWEIISKRIIRLDGSPGENTWGPETFSDRIYGLHGTPGGRGGSFFGIVDNTINGENLRIESNGGNGSNGQDGHDLVWTFEKISWCDEFREDFQGRGGKGGNPGIIEIFNLHYDTNFNAKLLSTDGNDGRSGKVIREEINYDYFRSVIIKKESSCQLEERRMKNELSITSYYLNNFLKLNFRKSVSNYISYIIISSNFNPKYKYLYEKMTSKRVEEMLFSFIMKKF